MVDGRRPSAAKAPLCSPVRLLVALVVLFAAFASTTSGGVTSSYGYDGDGRRLSSTTGGGGADLRFVWDALAASGMPELALERDSSGSLVRRYLGGPTGALNYTTSGGTFWYHHDPLNTVTDVTDAGGGAQWRYEYEAYGAQRSATNVSGSAPENRLRFNGQQLDLETGLLHLRARQYDPGTGRFGALDPVENPLLDPYASAYGYVNGRPTLFVDPEGLFLKQLGEVLAGGADTVSFGASTRVLEAGGVDINTDSNYFQAGQVGGSFVGPGGVGAYVARRAATQGLGRGARTLRGGAVGSGTAMSDCLIRGAVNGHGCTAEQAALDGLAGALGGTLLGPLAQKCIPRKAPTGPTAAKGVSVADKAADLRVIAGRNRVSIETPNGRLSVDLEGKAHFDKTLGRGVDTPHVKVETRHVGPDGRVSYTAGPVREATHADHRLVARILAERGR